MLYTITLDEDNYITSISHTANDDVELDLEKIELVYLNAYQYIDGVLSFDEKKKAQIMEENEQADRFEQIEELYAQLKQSDEDLLEFIEELFSLKNPLTFISDMIALMKNYATLVATRQDIRQQIKQLGG